MQEDFLTIKWDGACDNNSKFKFMGVGVAVWFNGVRQPELETCKMLGTGGTSNIAEWDGLLESFKTAYAFSETHSGELKIRLYGDSQLIVRQINGVYQVKKEHFLEVYTQSKAYKTLLKDRLKSIKWIPRQENKEADVLSKKAIVDYLEKLGAI